MPIHFIGKRGPARKKALKEHRAAVQKKKRNKRKG
jgi:hypothetical protein